jgi:hypothetical protein
MMLADHAQVSDGKLFISGGGWSIGGPGPIPCGVALLFHVPWDRTNHKTSFTLRLADADGQPAMTLGPLGEQPIVVAGQFEVGRPAGVLPGTDINVPIAFNTILAQLEPGRQYTWILEVDGYPDDNWRLSFATRALPTVQIDPPNEPPAIAS